MVDGRWSNEVKLRPKSIGDYFRSSEAHLSRAWYNSTYDEAQMSS